MPSAPALACARATGVHLLVLTCGLKRTPSAFMRCCMRSMLRCMRARSITAAGVSRAAKGWVWVGAVKGVSGQIASKNSSSKSPGPGNALPLARQARVALQHTGDGEVLQGDAGHVEHRNVISTARKRGLAGERVADFGASGFRRPLQLADAARLRGIVHKDA